ncbi:hypothetical protein [Paraflavitalea speifideaquila]|uniref:hypothetical protein n=1 Tax=Paraflavitalea speifideaquila TaxID=3076558 RepID=UPI0028ED8F52|nr:hypothetical protein [Paraflavitalea speifideiaquila]
MSTTTSAQTTWKLGGDIVINRLGYGAMQLAGKGAFGEGKDRETAKKYYKLP